MKLDILTDISEQDFIDNYIAKNKPAVIKGVKFDKSKFTPDALKKLMAELPCQVYNSLFDLQNTVTLATYIDEHFGIDGDYRKNVPYVRWYNKLKDVDYFWGDEAFSRLSPFWEKPAIIPSENLVMPATGPNGSADPVTDNFPYRGILVAARGARTRLHTDPFCSDAFVTQFYGSKEVAMYHPDRRDEMLKKTNGGSTSFGGYIDVRGDNINKVSHEPDFYGVLGSGETLYVPHGWLHDVLVLSDSVSITWNIIHEKGALDYIDYLMDEPEKDSEFEVLKYMYSRSGQYFNFGHEIIKEHNEYFAEIESEI